MQNLSHENELNLHENETVDENNNHMDGWFRTKTRFDREAKGSLEMAY